MKTVHGQPLETGGSVINEEEEDEDEEEDDDNEDDDDDDDDKDEDGPLCSRSMHVRFCT